MRGRFRLVFSLVLTLGWMGFIFYMSSKVAVDSDAISDGLIYQVLSLLFGGVDPQLAKELSHPVRKLAHFSEYTVLGLLLTNTLYSIFADNGLTPGTRQPSIKHSFGVWAVGALYAASDEFHQGFVPGRSPQITDVLIDSSGVLLGIALFIAVSRFALRK